MVDSLASKSSTIAFKEVDHLSDTTAPEARLWQAEAWLKMWRKYGMRAWAASMSDGETLLGYALLREETPCTMATYWGQTPNLRQRLFDKAYLTLDILNGPIILVPEAAEQVHSSFCNYIDELSARRKYHTVTVRPPYFEVHMAQDRLAAIYSRHGFIEDKKNTFVVKTNQPLERLKQNVDKKKRTKLNRSVRDGIEFEQVTDHAGVERYWNIRCQNFARNGQSSVPLQHFIETWDILKPQNAIEIFLTRHNGQDLAAQTLFCCNGDISLIGVAVSNYNIQNSLPGNEFLQWKVIEWAHENGYTNLDYVGATPDTTDPKLKAIHSFKKSWGGELVEFPTFTRTTMNPAASLDGLLHKARNAAGRLYHNVKSHAQG